MAFDPGSVTVEIVVRYDDEAFARVEERIARAQMAARAAAQPPGGEPAPPAEHDHLGHVYGPSDDGQRYCGCCGYAQAVVAGRHHCSRERGVLGPALTRRGTT